MLMIPLIGRGTPAPMFGMEFTAKAARLARGKSGDKMDRREAGMV